jgi:uncharacterized membrane protein YuzA (DUF378 family)
MAVPSPEAIAAVGIAIGLLYGLFGVGSAFATPLLAAIGVPGLAAVVSPSPPCCRAQRRAHGRTREPVGSTGRWPAGP